MYSWFVFTARHDYFFIMNRRYIAYPLPTIKCFNVITENDF